MGLRGGLVLFYVLFACAQARAEAVYPVPTPQRFYGTQQGKEGSCMAEAWTAAMEHAFAVRGQTVRVSPAFNHADNWKDSGSATFVSQEYRPEDPGLLNHWGGLIPNFLLPEDGRGVDFFRVGQRPSVSRVVVNSSGFPAASAFGYKKTYYSLEAGWSNSMRDLNTLKQWVRERRPVSISIDSSLINKFMNDATGLLAGSYDVQKLMEAVNSNPESERRTRHQVALVGFDDSLQGGSFIVRNSWNENFYLDSVLRPIDPADPALASFKAKIDKDRNQPGYYAVPYQYYVDLMARHLPGRPHPGDGSIYMMELDFNGFANHYFQHQSRHEVLYAPFVCDWRFAEYKLRKLVSLSEKAKRTPTPENRKLFDEFYNDLLDNQRRLTSSKLFSYATLSRSADGRVDRVAEFYAGALNSYYCPDGKVDIPPELVNSPEFYNRVREISADPHGVGSWLRFYKFIIQTLNIRSKK